MIVQDLVWNSGLICCARGSYELCSRPHKHTDLVWRDLFAASLAKPIRNFGYLFFFRLTRDYLRYRAVEQRYRSVTCIDYAISVRRFRAEQPICLHSNLMRGAVIHMQRAGSTPHVDTR